MSIPRLVQSLPAHLCTHSGVFSHTGAARCAYRGIEFINLGSFQIGCILLSGLFLYDVFWVFLSKPLIGSNVMVTVAKSFKGPIKFLFKKPGCDVRMSHHRSSASGSGSLTALHHALYAV